MRFVWKVKTAATIDSFLFKLRSLRTKNPKTRTRSIDAKLENLFLQCFFIYIFSLSPSRRSPFRLTPWLHQWNQDQNGRENNFRTNHFYFVADRHKITTWNSSFLFNWCGNKSVSKNNFCAEGYFCEGSFLCERGITRLPSSGKKR